MFVLFSEVAMSAIPVFKIDLVDPASGDLMFFGVRITRFDFDGHITNVVQRDYYISTPTNDAIDDLIAISDYGKAGAMR